MTQCEELVETIYTPTLTGHDYTYSGAPEVLEAEPDSSIRLYTGVLSFEVLVATFRALRPTVENMCSWSQMQRFRNKGIKDVEGLRNTMKNCELSLFDQFCLVIYKLRADTLNQVLADTLKVSQTSISCIFITWADFLYFMLGSFCIWPSRARIQKFVPDCCRKLHRNCGEIHY